MLKIAIIKNGFVVNRSVWDDVSVWAPPSGDLALDITNVTDVNGGEVNIGWSYDGQAFYPPGNQSNG